VTKSTDESTSIHNYIFTTVFNDLILVTSGRHGYWWSTWFVVVPKKVVNYLIVHTQFCLKKSSVFVWVQSYLPKVWYHC